jgi:nucleoid-associated protein YgaU
VTETDDRQPTVPLVLRAALALAGTTGATLALGRLLLGVATAGLPDLLAGGQQALTRSGPDALDAVVGPVAAGGALLVLGWLALALSVEVVAQARAAAMAGRPRRLADRPAAWLRGRPPVGAPLAVRRLAAALLGVALAAGPAVAHAAVDRPAGGPGHRSAAPAAPGASPDRPAGGTSGPADTRPLVVVRSGDTLWSLAAARLGAGSDHDPAVAAAWPRWWRSNRAVIGRDPDLIRPGQVLHAPHVSQEER